MPTRTYEEGGVLCEEVIDDSHNNHIVYPKEIIRDNPGEVTEWCYCQTCNLDFMRMSATILGGGPFDV